MLTNEMITNTILQEEAAMIDFRRELHQHPELSMEEFETTKRIARELDKLDISYRLTEPTGIIAEISGGQPGKTVLLRADIDALPIYEMNRDLSYRSGTEGKMHACGHDAHAAMLLTAAKALVSVKDQLKGTVRLVFQPAEESALGAKKMIEQGVTDGIDNVFGIHIATWTQAKQFRCPIGEMMAACDILKIRFVGKGGHGAHPNEAIDAAVMASAFVVNVQAVVAREINPLESAVVTIGKMDVGDRFNVIAHEAVLDGTVRTFNETTRTQVEAAVNRYAKAIAMQYRGEVEVDYVRATEPVSNEVKSAELVRRIVRERFGADALEADTKTTGGEDFGFYMLANNTPGAFAMVGTRNEAAGSHYEHHHGMFNIDESTLKDGAELYALYAYNFLEQADENL